MKKLPLTPLCYPLYNQFDPSLGLCYSKEGRCILVFWPINMDKAGLETNFPPTLGKIDLQPQGFLPLGYILHYLESDSGCLISIIIENVWFYGWFRL